MPVLKKLKDFLHKHNVKYQVMTHSPAYTSQELAASQHLPGKQMAKVVMLKSNNTPIMAVLPASYRIDLARFQEALGKPVQMELVHEFLPLFPECEAGAEPPFGNLFGVQVWADTALGENEEISFNAGNYRQTVRMRYDDFVRLVKPRVATFAEHL
ncbi:MAG: YbaK/EbsC family protein [Nitrospirae bacterium]|nr:YbaK/EbsC family protein [Nitrospirota bacterium]